MSHWTDPERRGLYDHPHAPPPPPAHHAANDHGSRLARVEEHLNFQAWNQRRAEQESRMRDEDAVEGMTAISWRVTMLEQAAQSRDHLRQTLTRWTTSAAVFARYAAAAVIGLLLLMGKTSLENVKFLMHLLGFPGG